MNYRRSPKQLTIFSDHNTPVNQYRVRKGNLQFRALDEHGSRFRFSRWRALSADEIALHSNLNTPVAEWLNSRLLTRASFAGKPIEFPVDSAQGLLHPEL